LHQRILVVLMLLAQQQRLPLKLMIINLTIFHFNLLEANSMHIAVMSDNKFIVYS
jgi:hypothetical protein